MCSPVSVCKWCKGNVLLLVDCRLLGRFHWPDNRSSCEFCCEDIKACITCKKKFHICSKLSNSFLHPPQVKHQYKRKRDCDIWASTSKHLGPALLFDISLEERPCLWGQFLPTHLLIVLPLQDYKEFQMDLMMKISFYFHILCTWLWKQTPIYDLRKLEYNIWFLHICGVCPLSG